MQLISKENWTLEELEKLEKFCDSIGKPDTFNVETTALSTCISDILYYKQLGWIETDGPNSKPFELGE